MKHRIIVYSATATLLLLYLLCGCLFLAFLWQPQIHLRVKICSSIRLKTCPARACFSFHLRPGSCRCHHFYKKLDQNESLTLYKRSKDLINAFAGFSARKDMLGPHLVRKVLALFFWNSKVRHVTLVPCNHNRHWIAQVLSQLEVPSLYFSKRVLVGDVIDKKCSRSAAVVHLIKRMILFLACSVPEVNRVFLSCNVNLFILKGCIYRTCLVLIKLVLAVLECQTGLAHSRCTNVSTIQIAYPRPGRRP